jgi:hypothetical protein
MLSKLLSKLLNEKDEAEAYISCMVLGFLLTWQEATRDEKAIAAKLAQEFVEFSCYSIWDYKLD